MPNFGKLIKNDPDVNIQKASKEIDEVLRKYKLSLTVRESVVLVPTPQEQESK